jgi:hypothetical protein
MRRIKVGVICGVFVSIVLLFHTDCSALNFWALDHSLEPPGNSARAWYDEATGLMGARVEGDDSAAVVTVWGKLNVEPADAMVYMQMIHKGRVSADVAGGALGLLTIDFAGHSFVSAVGGGTSFLGDGRAGLHADAEQLVVYAAQDPEDIAIAADYWFGFDLKPGDYDVFYQLSCYASGGGAVDFFNTAGIFFAATAAGTVLKEFERPVPEPASGFLLVTVLGAMGFLRPTFLLK